MLQISIDVMDFYTNIYLVTLLNSLIHCINSNDSLVDPLGLFLFLDCKEIQPVHSKGDQSWVFFGRNDAEAETPVLWPPHAKS